MRIIGKRVDSDGKVHRITVSKSGFATKKEALDYLPLLTGEYKQSKKKNISLIELYKKWYPTHKVVSTTKGCYKAAFNHFAPLWYISMDNITIDDLQECMDECPAGKRTRENMKALCNLIYKYGIPRGYATLNMGKYLIVNGEGGGGKDGLPIPYVEKLFSMIDTVPFADYIVSQCFLGFRPSELLILDITDYNSEGKYFIGGIKTEAGKGRTVTVSPKIQPIIDRLTAGKTSGKIFCAPDGSPLGIAQYRKAFYAALEQCNLPNEIFVRNGIEYHQFTPHSCRHTFATLLKAIKAPDKDKLELIGHTSTKMLRHYQDVDLTALKAITENL